MKQNIIDTIFMVFFFVMVVLIVACMASIVWSAFELHAIHHEIQVYNETMNW